MSTTCADIVRGGDDNDRIYGDVGDDNLSGGRGDDWIEVCTAATISLLAMDGEDGPSATSEMTEIDGGRDNDTLMGDAGDDTLVGGHGDDSIDGYLGDDTIRGDDGDDHICGFDGKHYSRRCWTRLSLRRRMDVLAFR